MNLSAHTALHSTSILPSVGSTLDTGWEGAWYTVPEHKEAVINNFARLGKSWLEGEFDWKNVLLFLAQKFKENGIEWYIIGSVGEAVLGVDIKPHDIDIDIGVHTRDFYKVKYIFTDFVIEPLGDNKGIRPRKPRAHHPA